MVDDDPMVCMAIEVYLERNNFQVTIADGGDIDELTVRAVVPWAALHSILETPLLLIFTCEILTAGVPPLYGAITTEVAPRIAVMSTD